MVLLKKEMGPAVCTYSEEPKQRGGKSGPSSAPSRRFRREARNYHVIEEAPKDREIEVGRGQKRENWRKEKEGRRGRNRERADQKEKGGGGVEETEQTKDVRPCP